MANSKSLKYTYVYSLDATAKTYKRVEGGSDISLSESDNDCIFVCLVSGESYKCTWNASTNTCNLIYIGNPFTKGGGSPSAVLRNSGSTASGKYSVAEGRYTTSSGNAAHAGGNSTVANTANQTVIGQFNILDTNQLFIVGNGDSTTRKNIFTVSTTGTVMAADGVQIKKNSSTDYVSLVYDNANKCLKFVFK